MKNEYKHDVFLYQSITSHLFVCDYADQEQFPANRIPISISGDVIIRKKIIKPDSTHVIPYNCEGMIASGFDQVSFEGTVPYFLVDEKRRGYCGWVCLARGTTFRSIVLNLFFVGLKECFI